MGKNLLSIGAVADNSVDVRLSKTGIILMSRSNVIPCGTRTSNGLYYMHFETVVKASANVASPVLLNKHEHVARTILSCYL